MMRVSLGRDLERYLERKREDEGGSMGKRKNKNLSVDILLPWVALV